MRLLFVTLLVTISPLAVAQQPVAEDLDAVLRGWQVAKQKLKTFGCAVERSSVDKALGIRDQFNGRMLFAKVNEKADGIRFQLKLEKANAPQIYEKYTCTGTELHVFDPAAKVVRVHKLPAGKQARFLADSVLASILVNGADELKGRFDMTIVQPEPPDPIYHYLLVRPRNGQGLAEFTEARISLLRSNHMPAQIWLVQPNRTEVTWNLTAWKLNVDIPAKTFEPEVPDGWKVVPVPPPALPKRMP
jgi:TIGR03009 family protein